MIPKALINFIKFLEFLNPYLCMRFAAYLWTKPIKSNGKTKEKDISLTSETFFLKVKSINKIIKCYHWKELYDFEKGLGWIDEEKIKQTYLGIILQSNWS